MAVDTSQLADAQLREQTLEFLREQLPAGWMDAIDAGDEERYAALRRSLDYRDWCRRLGEAGYATPTWPAEYGAGLSLTPMQAKHVNEVLSTYRVPRPFNIIGIGMGGPTVITWGTEDQKHQLLRGLATNEEIWCQLFSEPGAGSDVAGLSTRAVRDGDEWIVTGQKVWTTLAHLARYGMLLARTNPDVPKHKGLSYFVLDMRLPGVEIRPLVQITGDAEFNEVFLENVRIPDAMRVGPAGEGWRVAITTLMNERVSLSGAGSLAGDAVGGSPIRTLMDRHRPVRDPLLRQRLAQAYIDGRLIRLNNQRAGDKRKSGSEAGPEGSITKLMQAEFNQRLQKLAVDMEGAGGAAWEPTGVAKAEGPLAYLGGMGDDRPSIARGFLRAQANTIEGGTSNVMRNILGERVLGLPKEPDNSRDLAWKDVPRSA
ncbi:MAG TPA: acyl-CoA dehydrogenase family protein [Acidimicrobiia bacterium]|jgi:alkylation response protein AidB-like acyl-CoA dehydrogenase|nr:acyl-CoA dehydrogenase family protein [Acidimicrobiia bacterium]